MMSFLVLSNIFFVQLRSNLLKRYVSIINEMETFVEIN